MLGGLVVIAAGFVQNEINYSRTTAKNAAMAHEQRVETRVAEIQKHSIDFQTYAGAFVSSVLDRSEDIESRREALVDNILAQDAALDVSLSILQNRAEPQISQYRMALREMKNATDETHDVISMSRFWAAASDLLVARNELMNAIAAYREATQV